MGVLSVCVCVCVYACVQVCDRGAGSALLLKPRKIEEIARAGSRAMSLPLTLKTRKGYYDNQDVSGHTHTHTHMCTHTHTCAHTHTLAASFQ